jgi:two-component system chemotaxis response regulator CheB
VITQHRRRGRKSVLARLLARRCKLPVKDATPDERLRPSVVYLAPPDHHLVVDDDHLGLTAGPPVNFSRPSIDVTFRSVASRCGSRAIGVVLSGGGCDGAKGLRAIKDAGGTTIVQDPRDARVAMMPLQALAADHVDFTLRSARSGRLSFASSRKRRTAMIAIVRRRKKSHPDVARVTPERGDDEAPHRPSD